MFTRNKFLFLLLLLPSISFAVVDMRNANYAGGWTDLDIDGKGYDLKIKRTYNSRTVYNGIFGFGWCTDFETKMEVTADNAIRVTQCGAGSVLTFKPKNYSDQSLNRVIKQIMTEIRKRNKGRKESYFTNLEKEIRRDNLLRDEFSRQLKISGSAKKGTTYYGDGRANDQIVKTTSGFRRTTPQKEKQFFNATGQLVKTIDPNGNFLNMKYKGKNLVTVSDNSGNTLQFKYAPNSKYVRSIVGPKKLQATYKYEGEKLVEVINAWKNKYTYDYDDLYNLTKATYPDGTSIAIDYNKDKDWVTSFKDRKGCIETYEYVSNPKDPLNNYSSEVIKKCGDKVTNRSKYEFWHKVRKDGSRYLARSTATVNGSRTQTNYHPIHGRPTSLTKDGYITRYEYLKNGQLKKRMEPNRVTAYKYGGKCNKVKEVAVTIRYKEQSRTPSKVKKKAKFKQKTLVTQFTYSPKSCNLDIAKNSDGQYAKLKYDRQGRIIQIKDQTRKVVNIQYDKRSNKPSVVSRPGLGTIKFKYKPNGDLEKIDSKDEPMVAVQVANMFSNLLEIIGPATAETPI